MSSADGLANEIPNGISALPRRIVVNLLLWFEALGRTPRAAYFFSLSRTEYRSGIAIGVVCVAILMVYVDAPAATWARALPGWLLEPVGMLTDFGKSSWFLVPVGIVLLAIAALDRPELTHGTRLVLASISARLGFLFVAIAGPGLFVAIVKRLIGRARPLVEGNDPFLFHPFAWQVKYAALPSGHATTAFAAAFAVGALWPGLRPVMWVYAIGVAFSRVALTSHHPSDVLAGVVVAWLGVTLVRDMFAFQGLGFVVSADGVRRRPGPSWRRIKAVARALIGQ